MLVGLLVVLLVLLLAGYCSVVDFSVGDVSLVIVSCLLVLVGSLSLRPPGLDHNQSEKALISDFVTLVLTNVVTLLSFGGLRVGGAVGADV